MVTPYRPGSGQRECRGAGGALCRLQDGRPRPEQRIARPVAGKSGGFRTIVLFRAETRAISVYGFAKSARDNIDADELAAFRALAAEMAAYDDAALDLAIGNGTLIEVESDGEAVS